MTSIKLQQEPLRTTRRARLLVALAAALGPALIWTLAVPVLGIELTVPKTPGSAARESLEVVPLLWASTIAVIAGWGLLAVLERVAAASALRIWTPIALAVLVLSLPWMPGFTLVERGLIGTMHLALGVVLIIGMRSTSSSGSARATLGNGDHAR